MIHNSEELIEVDRSVNRLHREDGRAAKLNIVRDLMRQIEFHDWPEWAPKHRWRIHSERFNQLDHDDAEILKSLVSVCVTFLKSGGQRGDRTLHKAAQAYLVHREIQDDEWPFFLNVDGKIIKRATSKYKNVFIDWETHPEKWMTFDKMLRAYPKAVNAAEVDGTISSRSSLKHAMNQDLAKLDLEVAPRQWLLKSVSRV